VDPAGPRMQLVPPSRPPCLLAHFFPRVRTDGLRPCGRSEKTKKKKIFFCGSSCALEKREKEFQFLVFSPQDLRAPRALRAKPQEEEGFFDLVPLVTHPSSIPLLGGLTPKFLSLSLHSF
jgi:hypothetical protein